MARRRRAVPSRAAAPLAALLLLLLPPGVAARLLVRARGAAGAASTASHGAHHGALHKQGAPFPQNVSVYYVAELLDKLKLFAQNVGASAEDRFHSESARLSAATSRTSSGSPDHAALELASKFNEEDHTASELATTEMLEFYYTAKGIMGASSTAPTCQYLACGQHASCRPALAGRVRCVCDACYKGDGFRCRPAPCTPATLVSAQAQTGPRLRGGGGQEPLGDVAELQLAVVAQDRLAVVVRDASNHDHGFLILGSVAGMEVKWGTRMLLTDSAAFGVTIAGLPNGRLAVGFRDADQGGASFLMGAEVGSGDQALQAVLAPPREIATGQYERMVIVALASSRVLCLYPQKETDAQGKAPREFAAAALVEILQGGVLRPLGTYRFAEGLPVRRMAAVQLSPVSLVVAYQAMPPVQSMPGSFSRELSAQWIGMAGSELVIDPHPISLETNRVGMLDRDVALVAQNTFAYSYESGEERTLKMAVVRVDPSTHLMTVLSGPQALAAGSMDFVHSISLPTAALAPTTFTVFQRPGQTCRAEFCRVTPEGRAAGCREVAWADLRLRTASGARLPDGRLAFAMADEGGHLLYQLLGSEEIGLLA